MLTAVQRVDLSTRDVDTASSEDGRKRLNSGKIVVDQTARLFLEAARCCTWMQIRLQGFMVSENALLSVDASTPQYLLCCLFVLTVLLSIAYGHVYGLASFSRGQQECM